MYVKSPFIKNVSGIMVRLLLLVQLLAQLLLVLLLAQLPGFLPLSLLLG
jgi:hypothetical protein